MGYEFFDIPTIVISGLLFILNFKKIKQSSLYIIYLMFFGIYVVPLILDYVVGFPTYHYYWDATSSSYDRYEGFIKSYQHINTRFFYDVFILVIQIVLLYYKNNKRVGIVSGWRANESVRISKSTVYILVFFAFLPSLICIYAGYYYVPFIFGWRENPILSAISQGEYYSFVERLSYVGLASSMICMVHPKVNIPMKMFIIILCYMNLCIESKRSILFFAMAFYILLKSCGLGIKLNTKTIAIISLIGIRFVLYQSIYIKMMRGYSDEDILYTQVRIDLFRDDTARMIIYSLLSGTHTVLEYPFQSYLTQIAFIFPLDIINGIFKPGITTIGFNRYLTCALIGVPVSSGERWMTTSMIDEIIANFSILSVIIVPIVIYKLAKYIDKQSNITQILFLSAILLSFMYSFNYIAYYFEFVILLNYIIKKQRL